MQVNRSKQDPSDLVESFSHIHRWQVHILKHFTLQLDGKCPFAIIQVQTQTTDQTELIGLFDDSSRTFIRLEAFFRVDNAISIVPIRYSFQL